VFLFFVPLTLYYKANGLKKLSFYKDDGSCVGEVSTPPLAVGGCIALLRLGGRAPAVGVASLCDVPALPPKRSKAMENRVALQSNACIVWDVRPSNPSAKPLGSMEFVPLHPIGCKGSLSTLTNLRSNSRAEMYIHLRSNSRAELYKLPYLRRRDRQNSPIEYVTNFADPLLM
jgi:hypothetical protein